MGASKYNGVILPNLPETSFPHLLILADNSDFVLWASDQPFRASTDYANTFCNSVGGNYEVFVANMTYCVWERADVMGGDDEDAEYASFHGEYVWANHSIYAQNWMPSKMPTWDQANYPYLLLQRDAFSALAYTANLPTFWAWYSSEPFVLDDLLAPEVGEVAGPLGYGTFKYTTDVVGCQTLCLNTMVSDAHWAIPSLGEFSSDPTKIIGQAKFDPTAPATNRNFWANHEIVGTVNGHKVEENSWYEMLCYKASEPEAVSVPAPIGAVITGGNKTYDQHTTADALTCTATAPEGGSLSYKWYRYTDSAENALVCGYSSTHTPSTTIAGVWHYFCEVTNSQYGGTATVRTDSTPITVNAVEIDPDNPNTPSTPDDSETPKASKYKHIIGYVLKQAGVPMAELIAEILQTRNVGIGELIAYNYNGSELDALPDWNGFPYLLMTYEYRLYPWWYLYAFADKPTTEFYEEYWSSLSYDVVGTSGLTRSTYSTNEKLDWEDDYTESETGRKAKLSEVIWANFDVFTSEGELFLKASDPVPVYVQNKYYSYNGLVFPELPAIDRPYVLIRKNNDRYVAYFMSEIAYNVGSYYGWNNGHNWVDVYTNKARNRWGMQTEHDTYMKMAYDQIVWANFDVLNEDGSVYLPASDPIPVQK